MRSLKRLMKSDREVREICTGIFGRKYDADDCTKFLKERYGIDFSESAYKAEGWDKL